MKQEEIKEGMLLRQKFRDKSDERIERKRMREELAEIERYKENILSKIYDTKTD